MNITKNQRFVLDKNLIKFPKFFNEYAKTLEQKTKKIMQDPDEKRDEITNGCQIKEKIKRVKTQMGNQDGTKN